jgi:hypothetical protein
MVDSYPDGSTEPFVAEVSNDYPSIAVLGLEPVDFLIDQQSLKSYMAPLFWPANPA